MQKSEIFNTLKELATEARGILYAIVLTCMLIFRTDLHVGRSIDRIAKPSAVEFMQYVSQNRPVVIESTDNSRSRMGC